MVTVTRRSLRAVKSAPLLAIVIVTWNNCVKNTAAFVLRSSIALDFSYAKSITLTSTNENKNNVRLSPVSTPTSASSYTKLESFPDAFVHAETMWSANAVMDGSSSSSSIVLSSLEEYRQYVPLAVSCLVIVDILLGSPAANAVMSGMRPPEEGVGDDGIGGGGASRSFGGGTNPRERVDTEKIKQEALERAKNQVELLKYLERNKSDADRMNEMRRKIDGQISEIEDAESSKI